MYHEVQEEWDLMNDEMNRYTPLPILRVPATVGGLRVLRGEMQARNGSVSIGGG